MWRSSQFVIIHIGYFIHVGGGHYLLGCRIHDPNRLPPHFFHQQLPLIHQLLFQWNALE